MRTPKLAGTVNWGTATVIGVFAGMLYGGSKEASASVVDSMKKKLPWLKYDMKKAEYIEAKEKEKDAKKMFAKAMNELQGPIE